MPSGKLFISDLLLQGNNLEETPPTPCHSLATTPRRDKENVSGPANRTPLLRERSIDANMNIGLILSQAEQYHDARIYFYKVYNTALKSLLSGKFDLTNIKEYISVVDWCAAGAMHMGQVSQKLNNIPQTIRWYQKVNEYYQYIRELPRHAYGDNPHVVNIERANEFATEALNKFAVDKKRDQLVKHQRP